MTYLTEWAGVDSNIVTGDKKWFNFVMMPNKQQERHWLLANARRHSIFTLFSQKQMFTVFFDHQDRFSV